MVLDRIYRLGQKDHIAFVTGVGARLHHQLCPKGDDPLTTVLIEFTITTNVGGYASGLWVLKSEMR